MKTRLYETFIDSFKISILSVIVLKLLSSTIHGGLEAVAALLGLVFVVLVFCLLIILVHNVRRYRSLGDFILKVILSCLWVLAINYALLSFIQLIESLFIASK